MAIYKMREHMGHCNPVTLTKSAENWPECLYFFTLILKYTYNAICHRKSMVMSKTVLGTAVRKCLQKPHLTPRGAP